MNVTRILVDADACPVRCEIGDAAARSGARVLLFANSSQALPESGAAELLRADDGRDASDFALVSRCRREDIVVTDDLGLASMALGAGAAVISSRGRRFTTENMPGLLEERHIAKKARRAGRRTGGPRTLSREDRRRFRAALEELLAGRAPAAQDTLERPTT